MFTGLIEEVGQVRSVGKDFIEIQASFVHELNISDSVSCDGVCLSVAEKGDGTFICRLSSETRVKVSPLFLRVGHRVNLERALRVGDFLGGHYVTGHVDGCVRVAEFFGENLLIEFLPSLYAYIALKGSVSLNGVSLTVSSVEDSRFGVSLIPITLERTQLGSVQVGDLLHVEVDILSRYVVHFLRESREYKS